VKFFFHSYHGNTASEQIPINLTKQQQNNKKQAKYINDKTIPIDKLVIIGHLQLHVVSFWPFPKAVHSFLFLFFGLFFLLPDRSLELKQ
jgi:hypothetical protein